MHDRNELVFELKGRLPSQTPLSRMAAYMSEFAVLLGGQNSLLFSEVRKGSTCIAARAKQGGALGQARQRAIRASRGEGPKDAQSAFKKLCRLANDDRLPAKIKSRSGVLLYLPSFEPAQFPLKVRDSGHVTGELSGIVRDGKSGVKARIRPLDGGPLVYCTADEKIGREMGNYFLSYVRVYGTGWWIRDIDGNWSCESMQVESAQKLENVSISDAIRKIRSLEIDWSDDPFDFESGVRTA